MMKKFLYHGGFAALGISLLMGMAALQTNNRTRLGNTLSMGDSSEPPVSDVMADEPSTISQTITKDAAPLASVLPETKRGLKPGVPTKVIPMTSSQAKVTAPAKKGRLEVIKKPGALNTASTFLVYRQKRLSPPLPMGSVMQALTPCAWGMRSLKRK